eukprot:scaffold314_cov108-Isochrysis_galbana.AAC.6
MAWAAQPAQPHHGQRVLLFSDELERVDKDVELHRERQLSSRAERRAPHPHLVRRCWVGARVLDHPERRLVRIKVEELLLVKLEHRLARARCQILLEP